jgi:hypothetical protein
MSGIYQLLEATPPGPGATALTVGATSTAAQDISAMEGRLIYVDVTEPVYIRFGAAAVGAATVNDLPLRPGTLYRFRIPRHGRRSFFRAIRAGGADATLRRADASDGD